MPGPSAQTSGQGQHGAYNTQVLHANSTLKAFVGGKQRAWMANAGPVQPSLRPRPPPQQQQQQQIPPVLPKTPTNLLPSPTPSDEPSPALSNTFDGPDPRTRPLTSTAHRQVIGQVQAVTPSILPAAPTHLRTTDSTAVPAVTTAVQWTTAVQHATNETPSGSVRNSPDMAPPNCSQPNLTGQLADSVNGHGSPILGYECPGAQMSLAPSGAHPSKRRRIQSSAGLCFRASTANTTFSDLSRLIDNHTNQQGGDQCLQNGVETARFQLLRDACSKKDYFYLILHQLYCLRSIDPQQVSALLCGDKGAISMGFEILESVLKQNSALSESNLKWFASFPIQILELARSPVFYNVITCLACLAKNWTTLHEGSFNRVCPFLMDEMIGKLQCYSVVLQGLLFTASRRKLGVPDDAFGAEMNQYFLGDQQDHISDGQFQILLFSDEPGAVERRNQGLIQRYQQIILRSRQYQQQVLRRRQQLLIQRQSQTSQQGPALSPQQAHSMQSTLQPNRQYEQQQYRSSLSTQSRRASVQTMQPSRSYSQRPLASSGMMAPHHAVNSSPVPQNMEFCPPPAGHRLRQPSVSLVMHSSRAMAMPKSPITQSMPSPQSYVQDGLHCQQYRYGNHPALTQDTQSLQDLYPNISQMASAHQAAMHQQWPTGSRPSVSGQNMSPTPLMGSNRYGYGSSLSSRAQIPSQVMTNSHPLPTLPHLSTPIVPRPGQVIDRSEYPHSHHDKKSLAMSLHQAHARSPDRTRRAAAEEEERYYQAVRGFAIEPFRLVYFHELEFTVPPENYSLLYKEKEMTPTSFPPSVSTVREFTNGSLRYRLRCCRLDSDDATAESSWAVKETSWPDYIFPHFNQAALVVRRGTHNGKDLPVELTDFVVPGANKLKVATMRTGPTIDKKVKRFYLAVEILETLSHSAVLEHVWATGVIDSMQTLEKIRKRINAVPDEDGIVVIDRSGITASELCIDLSDPFSASICAIPARGAACTHMECFDLETWLNTRPTKHAIKCGHQRVCTCPKRLEPSEPDKWKCPICFADARPESLRIDNFLLQVRRQLEEQNKLDTKSILVAADGTWRPVIEPVEEDAGSDGDGPVSTAPVDSVVRKQPTKSISVERSAVEIIEID